VLQLFNVTLSHDKRSILLNDKAFFPTLPTIPNPPVLSVSLVRPGFDNNVSSALECRDPLCSSEAYDTRGKDNCRAWCPDPLLSSIELDYLYVTKSTDYNGNDTRAEAQYWEFGIDAIGTYNGIPKDPRWVFDNAAQKMLKVVVEGIELTTNRHGEQDSLFGPLSGQEKIYDYRIVGVNLATREFKFPPQKTLSFGAKFTRFLGNDVWEGKGRLVYVSDDWGLYGKEGTLRSMFGEFVHWHSWYLVAIIVGSVFGGFIVVYAVYRFIIWILEQRELMKWDGMDDVWDKLRREREEEEEHALLGGGYRDDPSEGSSPRPPTYTDELDRMKPLPTKPLPEKPLPEVPLIDA
jgi:hypothetical protein